MTDRDWDAGTYHRVSEPQVAWGRAVLTRLLALPLRGDETVLDAGCGTGRLTAELCERLPGCRVIALDASANMLATARETLRRFGDRVRFLHADLQIWSEASAAELVFSTATFHWVKDHGRLFANVFRTLRPGGWLCAQAGGAGNLARAHERADALLHAPPFASRAVGFADPWEFADPDTTRMRLERAGFTDIATGTHPSPVSFPDGAAFRQFVGSVVMRPYLAHLAAPDLEARFLDALTERAAEDRPPYVLDYVRLDMLARKPPAAG